MYTTTLIKPAPMEDSPYEPCRPVELTVTCGAAHWQSVQAGEYTAEVKAYPHASHYGFVGGRIRKLEIFKKGIRVWSYDRGQYLGYLDRAGREFLAAIVERFNHE
jgi:hypothetical protein